MANKAAAILIAVFLITILIIANGSHVTLTPLVQGATAEVTSAVAVVQEPTVQPTAAPVLEATAEATPEAVTIEIATAEATVITAATTEATAATVEAAAATAVSTTEATAEATAAATSEATGEATGATFVSASLVGDPAHGQQLFEKGANGAPACVNCHSRANAGKVGFAIGPGLKGLSERAATRVDGLTAPEYIEQSIRHPANYVVKGFTPIMYGEFAQKYSDQDIADLISYLMTL